MPNKPVNTDYNKHLIREDAAETSLHVKRNTPRNQEHTTSKQQEEKHRFLNHYITFHLADAFIQRDSQ